MRKSIILSLLVCFSFGCSNQWSDFWDIGHFKFCDSLSIGALEKVEVLYTTVSDPAQLGAYDHCVVVLKNSGDTINVLSPISPRVTKEQLEHYGLVCMDSDKGQYDKVFRDKEFDDIADNDFCTVYGSLGLITSDINKEIEKELEVSLELIHQKWHLVESVVNGRQTITYSKGDMQLIDLSNEHAYSAKLDVLDLDNEFDSYELASPNMLLLRKHKFIINKLGETELILTIEENGEHFKFVFTGDRSLKDSGF